MTNDPSIPAPADTLKSKSGHRGPASPAARAPGLAGADGFIELDGETYFRISDVDRMQPFLMSIASDTDLWMFVTSRGGLTAGRVDAEGGLFPYETADKLNDAHLHTGPITLVRVHRSNKADILWQPFAARLGGESRTERNLYKNVTGNRVVFEEIHHDLELAFRYRWAGCDDFGWVRTSTLVNRGQHALSVTVLDGLRNLLPYGAPLALYQQSSSLIDAYKRVDLDVATGTAVYSLTAKIIDRPEPAEVLRSNVVWCHGLDRPAIGLSAQTIADFARGASSPGPDVLTGQRGNYLARASLTLAAGEKTQWHLATDVGLGHVELTRLGDRRARDADLDRTIESSLAEASENLLKIVASADGLQLTGYEEGCVHHLANVLFNNMRGGVFTDGYSIPTADFVDFVETRNRPVAERFTELLASLPEQTTLAELLERARQTGDADLERLALEYLPLYFGRRHGDPSRPWNQFAIHVRDRNGNRALRYEGNWRDIFQNWEALALSFPGFLPSFIAKFVNASTIDGFNPYRLTRDGLDWELDDPADPWSYIGYWGDHQIIYLLKFLEMLPRYVPGTLESLLERNIFSYADVPYRLAPYTRIVDNPRETITLDDARAAAIDARTPAIGSDGKLLADRDGGTYHVNLLEKLLVTALSKLSNLVPDGGIWMNTQRPEWNDANNALVGNGVSVVTLCYLRRYLRFLHDLLSRRSGSTVTISKEVGAWAARISQAFEEHRGQLDGGDTDRRTLLDKLGRAYSDYRLQVYERGFTGRASFPVDEAITLCERALVHVDHAIDANRRRDGLYHTYNLIEVEAEGTEAKLHRLYEMLEGQVAALSSGRVDAQEADRLLTGLFASAMFREDQRSFMLYPNRDLPTFFDRNVIPEARVQSIPLMVELLESDDRSLIERDSHGRVRFNGDFANAREVAAVLDRLAEQPGLASGVARDHQAVLDAFETVFDHRSYTGRSGTMYGYEGLGCIYWHMVAKLLLAVQEVAMRALRDGEPRARIDALIGHYYRIRSGLGYERSAAEYGAFPTDPYSHTPGHAGAQQPGMTGQVKEEILTRLGELGVLVEDGRVRFRPVLIQRKEFRTQPGVYRFFDLDGESRSLAVPAGALVFSYCLVPVLYSLTAGEPWIRVTHRDGTTHTEDRDGLDAQRSRSLFERLGEIEQIEVGVPESIVIE